MVVTGRKKDHEGFEGEKKINEEKREKKIKKTKIRRS